MNEYVLNDLLPIDSRVTFFLGSSGTGRLQVNRVEGGGGHGKFIFESLCFLGKTWFFKNTLVPALRPGVNIFAKQLDPNETINGVSSLNESWSLKDIAELPRGSLVFYGKQFIIQ